jgi:hypothetical protein
MRFCFVTESMRFIGASVSQRTAAHSETRRRSLIGRHPLLEMLI